MKCNSYLGTIPMLSIISDVTITSYHAAAYNRKDRNSSLFGFFCSDLFHLMFLLPAKIRSWRQCHCDSDKLWEGVCLCLCVFVSTYV